MSSWNEVQDLGDYDLDKRHMVGKHGLGFCKLVVGRAFGRSFDMTTKVAHGEYLHTR